MATKWTEDQLKAIETRGVNLLVAAAAGSGKTAVLVERIIRIITNEESPVDIDKLLVVTFTSAAASEMRERIADAITKALEENPNSKVLQKQLTLLGRANITTMHSFCLDVIKNNYHTIDLDPSFRISDETENTLLKIEVINDIFEEHYEEEDVEFKKLIEAYSGTKNDEKLKEIILDLYRFSMSGPWPEKWLIDSAEKFNIKSIEELDKTVWVKLLKDNVRIEVYGYIKSYEKAIELIRDTSGLEPYEETFVTELEMMKNFYNSLDKSLDEVVKASNSIIFGRIKTVKKDKVSDIEVQARVKSVRDTVKKKLMKAITDTFTMTGEEALSGINQVYPYMKKLSLLTLEFMEGFKKKKKEKNILDFNDLEHLALKILIDKDENNNIIPSKVSENFREFFDEVLVDEYQDSNNVQETIIDLVSRKSLDNPNVFMVGDVKQSIYRFRQAKPELFLDKYNRYPLEEGELNRKIQLYKNFRSREEVLDGVNYIFKTLMSKTVGELEYNDSEALNIGASYEVLEEENTITGGNIELHILDKSNEAKDEGEEVEEEDVELNPEDFEAKEEEEDIGAIALEARIVAKRIKELMSNEGEVFKVYDRGLSEYRKLKFKDIVILLRATRNWAEIFLEELGQEGIPVYADTSSGYFDTIEIRTIMSLLKVIDNPMQDVPLISVLKSPIVGFSAEELTDLRLISKEKYFYEILKEIAEDKHEVSEGLLEKSKMLLKKLEVWREKALYTQIDEFIWYLYMDTAYYGYVGAMPNGKQRQANLKILFQRAKQFEKTSFKGLFNFINFINKIRNSSGDMGSAKILGEHEDVVRIMSIHKSKGLEFPVVFTSGVGKQFNLMDLNKQILYHDEIGFGPEYVDLEKRNSYSTLAKEAIKKKILFESLSEEMRILYVAVTRAKEKLIITGAVKNAEKTLKRWVDSASMDEKVIPEVEVLKGRSYMEWLGMALAKHRDGEVIRNGDFVDNILNDPSNWSVSLWTKNKLTVDKKTDTVDENKEELFIDKKVEKIDKEIKRRLDFRYKYKESFMLPSNVSVSDLKKSLYNSEYEDDTVSIFKEKPILKPRFMQEETGLTSAERGTTVHYIMQKLNLKDVKSEEAIRKQMEFFKECDLLSEEEIKSVEKIRFVNFFRSDLGKRMLKAYNEGKLVKREQPFYTEISSLEVNKELDLETYSDEKVRLQGIIDCFFEEDGEIVLLDYKTDYVVLGEEEKIIDRYRVQIKYYKDAVERITGKKVKASYLYLFGINKAVEVNLN